MNYKEFFKLINGGKLSGAYLLHGEEEYVKNAAVSAVRDKIPEEIRTFNLTLLYEPDLNKLVDACETLPVFSDKTYIIAKELPQSIDVKKLSEYISGMSPSTVLLIVKRGEVDKKAALLTAFSKERRDVFFGRIDASDAVKWCIKHARANNVSIDEAAAGLFIELVSTDMTAVSGELTKLIDRVGPGGTITEETIRDTSIGSIEGKTFGMLDLFISGKVADGLRSLRLIMSEDSRAPVRMISFLESRVRLMLKARILMDSGLTPQAAAAKLEGNPYANKYICRDASKYSTASLRELLSEISLVTYSNMTGNADITSSIETIMLRFDWRGNGTESNVSSRISQAADRRKSSKKE